MTPAINKFPVTIVYHYIERHEPYQAVSVWVADKEVVRYGNADNDKGAQRAASFVEGLCYFLAEDQILWLTYEDRHDYETFLRTPAPVSLLAMKSDQAFAVVSQA